MGKAAYERGTKAIQRQCAEQGRVSQQRWEMYARLDWREEKAAYRAALVESERLLEKARQCIRSQRTSASVNRKSWESTIERLRAEVALWRDKAMTAHRAVSLFRHRWLWVSRIVRDCLSPEQVHNWSYDLGEGFGEDE